MSSEFKKLHKDILLEWNYDSNNNIIEPFLLVENSKDLVKSWVATEITITNNNIDNSLILIDANSNKYAKNDYFKYNFLQFVRYSSTNLVRYDRVKVYLPSNYNFGQYQGFYLRLYTKDFFNKKIIELSNFFLDITDDTKSYLIKSIKQNPLLYQDRIWDRYVEISVPSVYSIAFQRNADNTVRSGSINEALSSSGLSRTSPIFIDFRFINKITTIGSVKNYILNQKSTTQVPQIPQFESLILFIEESPEGDYFEIYPKFNGSYEEFLTYMFNLKDINVYYNIEYEVTLFEENIKGKTLTFRLNDSDYDKLEYRPILKYSTSRAVIDVELKLINQKDGNIILKKGSYGLKPDQLSKYLINLKKINVRNTHKPKIYQKNQFQFYEVNGMSKNPISQQTEIEIPVPSINVIWGDGIVVSAFSDKALNKKSDVKLKNYHPLGKLKIGIEPFDNIIKFILAIKDKDDKLNFINLTNCQNLQLIFKTQDKTLEFSIYKDGPNLINYTMGMCQFKIEEKFYKELKIMSTQNPFFYITTTNQNIRNLLYSGLYTSVDNVKNQTENQQAVDKPKLEIIQPEQTQEFAVVTRRIIPSEGT